VQFSSNASRIGFKGAEDLGGGLKAIWQIESGVNLDEQNGTWASRNSFVGLSGGFGTVLLGNHDTPLKLVGRSVDLFGDQIGDNRNFTARSGGSLAIALNDDFATPTGAAVFSGGFDLRPNNVIAYVSPNFSGLTGSIAYITNVGDSGAAWDDSPDAWSASVKYENGPLMVGLGYQVHNLSELESALGDENVLRLAAAYTMGNLKFVGFYQKEDDLNRIAWDISNDDPDLWTFAFNNNVDRTTWGLGAAYKMGNMTFKGQYYTTNDLVAANSGADMYAVGVDYDLSKRTKLQLAYATTDNEANARYSAFAGAHGDQPTIANGGNPEGFSLGMRHAF
jgi:predicted porin